MRAAAAGRYFHAGQAQPDFHRIARGQHPGAQAGKPRLGGQRRRQRLPVQPARGLAAGLPGAAQPAAGARAMFPGDAMQRVAAAVAQTGYVVNSLASGLRSGRSSIITVFVSNLENPHFAATMQGIIDAFEAEGFIWGGKWDDYDFAYFEYQGER